MAKSKENHPLKPLTEYIGRKDARKPPEFPEDRVISEAYELKVGFTGTGFVYAFPMIATIISSPTGERWLAEGGFIKLPPGLYATHYVDLHERFTTLPKVEATSSDGAHVQITIGITYQVTDPIKIDNIRNPLDVLYKGCEAAIRHTVRSHKHDELIGSIDDPKVMTDNVIIDEVKWHIQNNAASCAFSLVNVDVIERQGDAEILDIRTRRLIQERTSEKELESNEQKQRIAETTRGVAVIEGEIEIIRAKYHRDKERILYAIGQMRAELKRLETLPQYQHDEILEDIKARTRAIESLIQALAMPGFPRTSDDLGLIDKIIHGLPDAKMSGEASPDNNHNHNHEEDQEFGQNIVDL